MNQDQPPAQPAGERAELIECTCATKDMTFGKCCKRINFENWYDSQPDGKLSPWDVFKAGYAAALLEADAQRPAMKPLTDEQIKPGFKKWKDSPFLSFESAFEAGVRFVETINSIKDASMKNSDLIIELGKMSPDAEVIVFTDGKIYPTLAIQLLSDGQIEIGCGWKAIDDEDE